MSVEELADRVRRLSRDELRELAQQVPALREATGEPSSDTQDRLTTQGREQVAEAKAAYLGDRDTITDIGTLIVRSPQVRGGRPRIAGTGVTVRRIVSWYKLGLTPEEIADEFGHLSLAQVYAALTYYHTNREEIEADLAAEEAETKRLERQYLQGTGVK